MRFTEFEQHFKKIILAMNCWKMDQNTLMEGSVEVEGGPLASAFLKWVDLGGGYYEKHTYQGSLKAE